MVCSQSCVVIKVFVHKVVIVVFKAVACEVLLVSSSFSCSLWLLVFSMVFYCLWFPTRKPQQTTKTNQQVCVCVRNSTIDSSPSPRLTFTLPCWVSILTLCFQSRDLLFFRNIQKSVLFILRCLFQATNFWKGFLKGFCHCVFSKQITALAENRV